MENQIITIIDEDGTEKQFRFLFSSLNSNTNEEFAFFIEINTHHPVVGAYKIGENNELINIETQEDMDYAQVAFKDYMHSKRGGCGCHSHEHTCECGRDCDCDGDCDCDHEHDVIDDCGCGRHCH